MNLHFFLLHFLTYRAITIAGVAFTLYSDANQFFGIFLFFFKSSGRKLIFLGSLSVCYCSAGLHKEM